MLSEGQSSLGWPPVGHIMSVGEPMEEKQASGLSAFVGGAVQGFAAGAGGGFSAFVSPTVKERKDSKGTIVIPEPLDSPLVSAITEWIGSVAPAPLRLFKGDEEIPDHPFVHFINDPNPFFTSGEIQQFWFRTTMRHGNAYSRLAWPSEGMGQDVVRGPPKALIPIQPKAMTVTTGIEDDLTTLKYQVLGKDYPEDEILHLRHHLDEEDLKMGESPFEKVKSHIEADSIALATLRSIMRNNIQAQIVFAPKEGKLTGKREGLIAEFMDESFTAEDAGGALSVGSAIEVHDIGKTPEELQFTQTHHRAEQRCAAVARVAAAVIGYGAGLDTGTRNQLPWLRRMSFEQGVEPLQRHVGQVLVKQLLPYWVPLETDRLGYRIEFDNRRHAFLREDFRMRAEALKHLVEALAILVGGGPAPVGQDGVQTAAPAGLGFVVDEALRKELTDALLDLTRSIAAG